MIAFTGEDELLDELQRAFEEAGIEVQRSCEIKAKAGSEIVGWLDAAGHFGAVAYCVSIWLRNRYKARKLMIQQGEIRIEVEAGSPAEIEAILRSADGITIERTTNDG